MCYCPEGEGTDVQLSQRVLYAARSAVEEVIDKANSTNFDLGDRTGGYFCCLRPPFKGPLVYPTLIAKVTNGRDERYRTFSEKKATDHMERLDKGYELSSEFRDPDKDMWGGSVKGIKANQVLIFSFSGLPELLDEAAMLLVAIRAGYLTMEHAREIAIRSKITENGNSFFLDNQWISESMIKCPGCDLMLPADDHRAQIKHMDEYHPDIIARRRTDVERICPHGDDD